VKRFVGLDEVVKSGSTLIKVGKLVDGYLAQIAMDSNLILEELFRLLLHFLHILELLMKMDENHEPKWIENGY
jgi:NPH3 family protein